jgi:hypothetical protein
VHLGLCIEAIDLGDLNKVVETLSVELEVEA